MSEQEVDEYTVDHRRCSCSVMGFEDPLWVSTYYPPECPEDWRVAYFCNDFHSVYLPAGNWAGNESLLDIIVEEIEPGFDLVLEWPADLNLSQHTTLCEQLNGLQQHIACVVINTAGLALSALRELLQILSPYFAVNIVPSASLDTASLVQEFSAALVWYPLEGSLAASKCRYQVVILPCVGLRDMTPALQQLDKALTMTQRAGMFLQPREQSPQRALELRTVIELMGMD